MESNKNMSHDKASKMSVRPEKTQISLGIRPVWRVFAVLMKKHWALNYLLSAQRRLRLDWTDAQADLGLRWALSEFVGFVKAAHICFQQTDADHIWWHRWKVTTIISMLSLQM